MPDGARLMADLIDSDDDFAQPTKVFARVLNVQAPE